MRTPRMSRQSIAPRILLSLTLALSLLFATASSVLADMDQGEGTLPSTGGTVEFASGVSIKAPDGAIGSDTTVTYTALEGDAVPGAAPEGTAIGSLVFSLDAGGASFSQFATITIPYTDDDLAAGGDRHQNVSVYNWDANSGSWLPMSPIPDVISQTLTIYQTVLGTYAVVVMLPAEEAPMATPTPEATQPPDEPDEPETGGVGVSNGMMMGLALLGMFFVLGGGYVLARNRR